MATGIDEKTQFGRKLTQLLVHFDLDSTTLTSLSTLFADLAAIATTDTERLRDIAEAVETWIAAQ